MLLVILSASQCWSTDPKIPELLKGKNKHHLPVFWKSNKTAWVTQTDFKEWFNHSFIPEVKQFLGGKNIAFKILLVLDNCKSHGDAIFLQHPNVTVEFLPANTTSLIQPMDQTVIVTFKSHYLKLVIQNIKSAVNKHRGCENFDSEYVVRDYWKKFTILDCIGYIDQSWQECSDTTINRSWSKFLPELVVNPRKGSSSYENNVESVVNMARAVGGEGFVDIEETEVLEMVMPGNVVLSVQDVEEIVNQPSDPKQANEESENNSEKQFYSSSVINCGDSRSDYDSLPEF